ncbi:hypothetical protein DPEC_G00285270 [Dallia pectoralis]|uniref:Uncharacterized protein n=1 Tax=Dallia pectoralis TaxID=75939 RepID=A0ACC2FJQ1_DALPE|nr:hypothetical protein DPEC_G00285270 [Dallia pectoralis]
MHSEGVKGDRYREVLRQARWEQQCPVGSSESYCAVETILTGTEPNGHWQSFGTVHPSLHLCFCHLARQRLRLVGGTAEHVHVLLLLPSPGTTACVSNART